MTACTLITGGAGFVGTNLAERLAADGGRVLVFDDFSRGGSRDNAAHLADRHQGEVEIVEGDVRDRAALGRAVRFADHVIHLAAATVADDPVHDAQVNVLGTVNLLEEARAAPRAPALLFASSSHVYGDLDSVALKERPTRYEPCDPALLAFGVGEDRPLCFRTPQGCSKGAAEQYVLDYGRSAGLPAVVFRLGCVYGPHQSGGDEDGWIARFLTRATADEAVLIHGDGKQLRDVLYVTDLVDAIVCAQEQAERLAGRVFNIGGGVRHALSPRELSAVIGELLGEEPECKYGPPLAGDRLYYVSDTSSFTAATGWRARTTPQRGVGLLHQWLSARSSSAQPAPAVAV